eukprot:121129-Chlamydomonas_euryale.AAC.1
MVCQRVVPQPRILERVVDKAGQDALDCQVLAEVLNRSLGLVRNHAHRLCQRCGAHPQLPHHARARRARQRVLCVCGGGRQQHHARARRARQRV